ncbi:hypothetical protein [Nocardia brasiliensis]|uniref:hypothetical protein n=1 Tax=Nocardia brasiliensis TaxID=37326 RepID=UPI001E4E481C|nr:hypothetical protein [Nocardia brasiliensis]
MAKTVVLGPKIEDPVAELIEAARRVRASAVIVSSTAHFEAERVPDELTRLVDVVSVTPEFTYARWTLNPVRWSESSRDPA